ncbi:SGNH/GDSL hydrolase family protein [Streptomyces sp. NPDC050418]|uniref:SGNH/GDSL hydrolase family protein n=1 Tax=Streptomyces sp. NPDC050418 TaxID=3365612 RepID=UPI0037B88376
MHFTDSDTLVFIGDSITDAGRDRTDPSSLGNGYVNEIARTLNARAATGHKADPAPRIINRGVNGHRIRDLAPRWTTDVLDHRPTHVTVKIGINDTWRRYDRGLLSPVPEFRAALDRLLDLTARHTTARLTVITPFLLPVRPDQHAWFEDLQPRTEAVLRAAADHKARIVRADLVLEQAARHHAAAELAHDGVHPTPLGHRLIADAWLSTAEAVSPAQGPDGG